MASNSAEILSAKKTRKSRVRLCPDDDDDEDCTVSEQSKRSATSPTTEPTAFQSLVDSAVAAAASCFTDTPPHTPTDVLAIAAAAAHSTDNDEDNVKVEYIDDDEDKTEEEAGDETGDEDKTEDEAGDEDDIENFEHPLTEEPPPYAQEAIHQYRCGRVGGILRPNVPQTTHELKFSDDSFIRLGKNFPRGCSVWRDGKWQDISKGDLTHSATFSITYELYHHCVLVEMYPLLFIKVYLGDRKTAPDSSAVFHVVSDIYPHYHKGPVVKYQSNDIEIGLHVDYKRANDNNYIATIEPDEYHYEEYEGTGFTKNHPPFRLTLLIPAEELHRVHPE